MKMTITNGVVLQALGIVLEGAGLLLAFGTFGSKSKRWLSGFFRNRQVFPSNDALKKEGFQYTIQSWLIGVGLLLQLIGLFI